jgi:hypothetical protein
LWWRAGDLRGADCVRGGFGPYRESCPQFLVAAGTDHRAQPWIGTAAAYAFDESGDAFVVFDEPMLEEGSISPSFLVRVAVRPVGGHWQIPDTLSRLGFDPVVAVGGHGEEPQVAANAKGDGVIVSTRQAPHHSEGIEVTLRSAGGAFSPSQTISGNENAFEPRVAMNASGDALVAWRVDTARGCPVRAAFHLAGGGWSRPRTVSDVNAFCEGGNHRVAIDEHGDAIVTWFGQRGPLQYVDEATRDADGRWRARSLLARARNVLRPEVAMDARGDAIVAWSQKGHEWTRARPAGRRWLAAQMVRNSQGSLGASLAVDGRGDALLAWSARGERDRDRRRRPRVAALLPFAARCPRHPHPGR